MTSSVQVHTIAILKGAVEGDAMAHLASIMAMPQHAVPLVRAGLVVDDDGEYLATAAGRQFYDTWRLVDLPAGRANSWTGATDLILKPAQRALDALQP